MKYSVIIIMILVLSHANGLAVEQGQLPKYLHKLEGAQPNMYFNKVKELPGTVLEAFGNAMQGGHFKMADHGGPWNKTDIVTDPDLPFRRLIWAAEIEGHYVIHYEKGGVGYSLHYLIVGKDQANKQWKVLWSATSSELSHDYAEFIQDLKDGNLHPDPSNSMH